VTTINDAAERLRGLPGLVLLESARPGRRARWTYLAADPLLTVEAPDDGPDPFDGARRLLRRLTPGRLDGDAPAWTGGLAGYLSYDFGRRLERLPSLSRDDQRLPEMRLGLYDVVLAWDRRECAAWLVGRAVDGDLERLRHRRETRLTRLLVREPASTAPAAGTPPASASGVDTFVSNVDRRSFKHGREALEVAARSTRPTSLGGWWRRSRAIPGSSIGGCARAIP
jgi:para-aminobenzoate synthetase component 1